MGTSVEADAAPALSREERAEDEAGACSNAGAKRRRLTNAAVLPVFRARRPEEDAPQRADDSPAHRAAEGTLGRRRHAEAAVEPLDRRAPDRNGRSEERRVGK